MEAETAKAISEQANSIGMAAVGTWVQEVAEMYHAGLKAQKLVVDISVVS